MNEVCSLRTIEIASAFKEIIWKNKILSIETKISMFKTYIRPIMTFAAETRADTSIKKGNKILRMIFD